MQSLLVFRIPTIDITLSLESETRKVTFATDTFYCRNHQRG